MTINTLNWRGKFLSSGKDKNNKKYISMNGNKSELYIPIQIEENTNYKIKIELRKESGNGIIHCDLFGNKNFSFEDIFIKCDNSSWENFEFFVTTKLFPKTLSFYFRILRKDGLGTINIANILVEKVINIEKPNKYVESKLVKETDIIIENVVIENKNVEEIKTDIIESVVVENKIVEEIVIKSKVIEDIKKIEDRKTKEESKMVKDKYLVSEFPQRLNEIDQNNIFVFTPYYFEEDVFRRNEINYCISQNIQNPLISKVFLFSDTQIIPDNFKNIKTEIIFCQKWTTFNYIINFINSKDFFSNSFNIISNTDMYFDTSLFLIKQLELNNSCIALSVWDTEQDKILNESSAQGAWIFKGKIRSFDCIIPMGKPGCDNRLLYELTEKKYVLYNLCYDIKVNHKHKSSFRKYNSSQRVLRPYIMLWSNRHK